MADDKVLLPDRVGSKFIEPGENGSIDIKEVRELGPNARRNAIIIDRRPKRMVSNMQSGRFMDAPMLCNTCKYRPINKGGNGKCPEFLENSVCTISETLHPLIERFDTRKPDDMRTLADVLVKTTMKRVLYKQRLMEMEDDEKKRQAMQRDIVLLENQLVKYMKIATELQPKIKVKTIENENEDTRQIERFAQGNYSFE